MNYADWPYAPKNGYKQGTNYITISLFIETHRGLEGLPDPLFSLSEADAEYQGKMLPSARAIYLHSKGEHDAMSKLVGSYKQWCRLKELEWFRSEWELWHAEWLMLQGQDARNWLKVHQSESVSAARTLFDDAKKADVGRPKKPKRESRNDADAEAADVDRVVAIRSR